VVYAGLGYAAFSVMMAFCRHPRGRNFQPRGGPTHLLAGGKNAASGKTQADWKLGVLGYAIVGIGCANIVPVLYTTIGRQNAMPESVAIPAVTTLGYAGMLAGPAIIGFLASATSLPTALAMLALLLLAVAACGWTLRL
jgi:hypothetical protein